MSYDKVNYGDVEAARGGMHFLRDPLSCEQFGITVVECPAGWTGPEHDHGDSDHEEVYLLVSGEATITIDGETVSLEAGDAVRIDPDSTREIQNGDGESTFVLVGAP